jgi:hypothetical protein
MTKLTTAETRRIIDDFAREIQNRKTRGPKPAKTVIDFRNERKLGIERDIYLVPMELLRYRKDNGRISSDVLNYEKNHGLLKEDTQEAQKTIRKFLEEKDKEKTDELRRSMQHEGQREPAIITCDGFLINGNRRKMVLEVLLRKYPGDERFSKMRVVILPGKGDEGGPPTLLEIEQIENRYQLQSEGKAEYYGFDRALSMRRKIKLGMSLEEQLRDDPAYAGIPEKQFRDEVKRFENDYLKPLECVDRYLSHLQREGLYATISSGMGDPEGRWQAFLDYSKLYEKLKDQRKRVQLGIAEAEVGRIEDIAFKIIRKRELSTSQSGSPTGLPKVHKIMRDLPNLLINKESKKELFKLEEVELHLPKADGFDKDGKEYDEREIDRIWGVRNATDIIRQVKKAVQLYEHTREREAPLTLLKAALDKLSHQDMDPMSIGISDIKEAMRLAREIKNKADELESEFYHHEKELKKLQQMYKGR